MERALSRYSLVDRDTVVVELIGDYVSLGTQPCGGGLGRPRHVLFRRVESDFDRRDLENFCREVSRGLGLDPLETAVFLTAYPVEKIVFRRMVEKGLGVEVYMTAGLTNLSCLDSGVSGTGTGTINILVVTDYGLSEKGLADFLRLVSEVKGSVMSLSGVSCRGSAAFGTVSDATMVAARPGGTDFAGRATPLGALATRALVEVFVERLSRMDLLERLSYILGGLSVEEVVETGLRIYSRAPLPGVSTETIRERFTRHLTRLLRDPNIVSLLVLMRLGDAISSLGLVPGLSREDYERDSKKILLDELLGKTLSEYIYGLKGLMTYYWIDREKSGWGETLSTYPVYTDDLVSALIGSILAAIYDEYLDVSR